MDAQEIERLKGFLDKIARVCPAATVRQTGDQTWIISCQKGQNVAAPALAMSAPALVPKTIEIKEERKPMHGNTEIFNAVASSMQQMFQAAVQESLDAVEKAKSEMKAMESSLSSMIATTQKTMNDSVAASLKKIEEKASSFASKDDVEKAKGVLKQEMTALQTALKQEADNLNKQHEVLRSHLDKNAIDAQRKLDEQQEKIRKIFESATNILQEKK